MPIVYPPVPWMCQDIVLYHGTVDTFVPALVKGTIRVGLGRPNTDFGPGFYTATLLRQAKMWAAQMSATRPGTQPAVVQITIPRDDLAKLETLAFVRGDFHADDYWSLVHYCRLGATDHALGIPAGYFDVVYGPVAAFWNQRMSITDADQVSFHTSNAEALLNRCPRTFVPL